MVHDEMSFIKSEPLIPDPLAAIAYRFVADKICSMSSMFDQRTLVVEYLFDRETLQKRPRLCLKTTRRPGEY
jgi:hypothetical protein